MGHEKTMPSQQSGRKRSAKVTEYSNVLEIWFNNVLSIDQQGKERRIWI